MSPLLIGCVGTVGVGFFTWCLMRAGAMKTPACPPPQGPALGQMGQSGAYTPLPELDWTDYDEPERITLEYFEPPKDRFMQRPDLNIQLQKAEQDAILEQAIAKANS